MGGLTGARTAGFLSRIPVEAIAADRHHHWRQFGFRADGSSLCLCTWVDNLFSVSRSLHGAIAILEDFDVQLRAKWSMNIKESSRSCMVAAGNGETPSDPSRWPQADTFVVLGHTIETSGSIRPCWSKCRTSMWRAFWANPGSKPARDLSITQKLSLQNRVVLPQISFRCSRWPPQQQIAAEVDHIQQKMTSSLLKLPREPGEEAEAYVRRRGREARKCNMSQGLWSQHWFGRAIRWDDHLARPANQHTWAAKLREYKGKEWLMHRRALFAPSAASRGSSVSITAGRTGTRSVHGKVHMRWHDGIDLARSYL